MFKKTLLGSLVYSIHCFAATYQVTTNNGGTALGAGTEGNLSYCLTYASSGDTISFQSIEGQTITLSAVLPQISQNIIISGSDVTLDGAGAYQAFVILSGDVLINNLTVQNTLSLGGSGASSNGAFAGGGGGGGTGGGAGLFVASGTSVTLDTLNFLGNQAEGGIGGNGDGAGGTSTGNFGGGGGSGGSYNGAGGTGSGSGGIGNGGSGGNGAPSPTPGTIGGGTVGGSAGAGGSASESGSPGGNGSLQGGGGGGGGTIPSGTFGGDGGDGALFGGGGGGGFGFVGTGGSGGNGGNFGGGGGGGSGSTVGGSGGGMGGFGAGGGGGADILSNDVPLGGSSSFGGGKGGNGSSNPGAVAAKGGGGGGGGGALGGAIFIEKDATLTLLDSVSFSGNSVAAGMGGAAGGGAENGENGGAFGEDIFLSSGGTLIIDITTPLTISSDIQSDLGEGGGTGGGLIKKGASTLTLSGENTYTGETIVSKGTLALLSEAGIGGTEASLTLGGEGSGSISLLGSSLVIDTLTINKDSSIVFNVGGSTFSVSGEVIGSNGSVLSSSGDGTIVLENIHSSSGIFTISAPISGSQPVTLTGNGTTVLSGDNTYTGITTVSSGVFTVNGTMTSPLLIQSGAKLKGTGEVNASVTIENGGTFSPGNSSGVMLVAGPVTFANGSSFNVDMDANGVSQVIATGPVTIGPDTTLVLTALDGFSQSSAVDTIILQGSSLSGTFSAITKNTPLLRTSLVYSADSLLLEFGLAEFSSLGLEGNPLSVGTALDEITSSGSTVLEGIVDSLATFTDSQISAALNQMQPSLFKGLTISQENNAVKVRDTLGYRMQNELDRYNCHALGKGSKDPALPCAQEKRNVHVWVDGFGDILRQKSNFYAESSQFGYQSKTTGVVLGIDGNFAKYFYAGALGSYTDSSIHWLNNQGKGTISTGYGGLYFSALSKMFYANAALLGSWSHFDSHRNIIYPGVSEKAKNTHGGAGLLSHLDTGINLAFQGITVRPFDSFDYLSQSEENYTETGAGAYNLKVNSNNSIFIRNELGVQFAGCICLGGGSWTLSPKVSWVREVRIKGSHYKAEFVNTDEFFTVTGYFPDRSLVSPGVMLSGSILKDRLTLDLYYNGEFGDQYSDHNYGGQVRIGF